MFANLRFIMKSAAKCSKISGLTKTNIGHPISGSQCYSSKNMSPDDFEILEVDAENMMYEDNDNETSLLQESEAKAETEAIASTDFSAIPYAPIDVNPWADEELDKDGTVDMEYIDKENDEIHYPEIPKDRSGFYEFEGITIWLPPKMLSPSTYRYRLDDGEEETLPDDIRICRFENFKPSSK